MTITAGTSSLVTVTSTTATLASTAPTGSVGPFAYQWYRSTTTGFSPGGGNIISGATSLTFTDSGLVFGTQYYYVMVGTDTGHSNATAQWPQVSVQTQTQTLSQNQFALSPYIGMSDQQYNYNTKSVIVAATQATALSAGQAVKISPSSGSFNATPQVVACTADTDVCFGFINFDQKTIAYAAGVAAGVSCDGNLIYLLSTGAITQGAQVTLDLTSIGGVAQATGSSGNQIVGFAYDGAAAAGQLIRVELATPSYTLDG